MTDDDRVEVCDTDELAAGDRRIVDVGQVSIGVFNVDGNYYALLNKCPHQGGALCEGEVSPEIEGRFVAPERHVEEYYADSKMVVCPLHGWAFDLEHGEHTGDPDISVPTFDVIEESGTLYLDV